MMYFDIIDYTMLCDFWPIAQKILKELRDSGMAKPFPYPATYLLEPNCLALKASGSFPMSQLFTWDGQSTGASALTSVPPTTIEDWSPSGWTG